MNIKVSRRIFAPAFLPLLLDNEHRVILLLGGGGSGKSYFSFQRAVYRALSEPNRKILIVRKSAVDVRRSCWEDLLRTLGQFKVRNLCTINQTTMEVRLSNGSLFLLMGLDDFEKVKSIPDINDILIEEASEITFDDYSQLLQRTRGKGQLLNQVVLMSNPVSKANWLFKHFFEDGCKEPSCVISRTTYKDNPFLNKETVDTLENYEHTNPYYYRVYTLGEWGSLSKQVFTNYRSEELDIEELSKRGYQHLVGLDFGFINDPTAIVDCLLDEDNAKLYVIREFFQTGLLNDEIAAQLKVMGLSKSTIIADSAEQKSIEEIRRAGISRIKPAAKGQGSVLQGIQKLQQYELIVDSSCFNLLEELENYSWKKDKSTGEYVNEPIDAYNHAIDALRYSLQCGEHKHRLKTLPKYSL